jgi:hypothetical protein
LQIVVWAQLTLLNRMSRASRTPVPRQEHLPSWCRARIHETPCKDTVPA